MGKKEIVFDPAARKDFLTGFHKRKNERKQKARQKIADRVRKERIEERAERRAYLREQRAAAIPVDEGGEASTGGDDEAPGDAETATYDFQGTLTTTVVSALLDEDQTELEVHPVPKPAGRGDSRTQPKAKKFNLDQPLAQAIPGYKAPAGLKARKAAKKGGGKKRGAVSKKQKAKQRGLNMKNG